MRETYTHAYVATAQCGCVEGVCTDMPDHRADVRKFVREQMGYGNDITRLLVDDARAVLKRMQCDEHAEVAS